MAAVPDAVLGSLLENLKDFVVTNADLIGGAEDNASQLCDELEVLKGFLKKCTEQKYRDDDFLSGLAKKVRSLVYKAEDAIETYIATVSRQKFRSTSRSALHLIDHVMELRNIGKELAALKQEMRNVYQEEVDKGLKVIQEADKDKDKAKDDEGSVKLKKVTDFIQAEDDDGDSVEKINRDGESKTEPSLRIIVKLNLPFR